MLIAFINASLLSEDILMTGRETRHGKTVSQIIYCEVKKMRLEHI